eukprot:symbB.v1.2.020244.t1/scaffold1693.1/size105633/14
MSVPVAAHGCEFYRSSDRPAFVYYGLSDNGSKIEVGPQSDPNGLCYFPNASCVDANFSCCRLTDEMRQWADHGTKLNLYSCLVCLMLPMLCLRIFQRIRSAWYDGVEEKDEETEDESENGDQPEITEPEEAVEEVEEGWLGSMAGNLQIGCNDSEDDEDQDEEPSRCRTFVACLTCVGFSLAIGAECYLMILTANITQRLLTVPLRNSMLAGDAFLVPLREIFQFLEDVVTVKVMAAIGSGATGAVRPILQLGVFGGAFFGIVAALCATLLCSWPSALRLQEIQKADDRSPKALKSSTRWLLAPYTVHDSALGCPLIPEGDEAANMAKNYLVLSVWCWPAIFVSMALRGFLLGLQEYGFFIFIGLVQSVTQIVLLYILFVPDPSLNALGWIVFVGSYLSLISTLGLFIFRRDLRQRYNLTICKHEAAELGTLEVVQISWKKASQEGFYAMLLDVAAQASITTGVYVAGAMLGIGAMYQVSAWQAAFPQYGLQWIIGVTYVLRLQGSRLVAAKEYRQFKILFRSVVAYGVMLALVAAVTLIPFRTPIAFLEAAPACEYASSLNCANIFASVFGGGKNEGDTLQGSGMLLFVSAPRSCGADTSLKKSVLSLRPTLIARSFYQLYKAGLYACLDWSFMAKTAVASICFVFFPAICVAIYLKSVSSILVAMYLPLLAMALAFLCRTRRNIKGMLSGRNGPWQKEL